MIRRSSHQRFFTLDRSPSRQTRDVSRRRERFRSREDSYEPHHRRRTGSTARRSDYGSPHGRHNSDALIARRDEGTYNRARYTQVSPRVSSRYYSSGSSESSESSGYRRSTRYTATLSRYRSRPYTYPSRSNSSDSASDGGSYPHRRDGNWGPSRDRNRHRSSESSRSLYRRRNSYDSRTRHASNDVYRSQHSELHQQHYLRSRSIRSQENSQPQDRERGRSSMRYDDSPTRSWHTYGSQHSSVSSEVIGQSYSSDQDSRGGDYSSHRSVRARMRVGRIRELTSDSSSDEAGVRYFWRSRSRSLPNSDRGRNRETPDSDNTYWSSDSSSLPHSGWTSRPTFGIHMERERQNRFERPNDSRIRARAVSPRRFSTQRGPRRASPR